jgi:sulfonate transport system ATP-binding protein
MTPLLETRIHHKQFGDRLVLCQVRLQLHVGEIVAIVGASGCGKSTLLRIIAGLDRDYEGEVRLKGRVLEGLTRDIGFIFQEPRLFPWLDVAHNVAFDESTRVVRGAPAQVRVTELLHDVGLAGLGTALPKQLSGGQAQRVAIARGLFNRPGLLLLDEPFSAVDSFMRLRLQDLLLRLVHQHGITVVMVTHDIEEAVHVSDRVLVMDSDPGTVRDSLTIEVPRPRDREHPGVPIFAAQVRRALHAVHAF